MTTDRPLVQEEHPMTRRENLEVREEATRKGQTGDPW